MILLTGATGRTGRAVLGALHATGADVRALHRREDQAESLKASGAAETILGDLDDPASLMAAAEGCATVIHIGPPMHPRELEHTEAMLQAAKAAGAERFVYYSVMHPLRREVRHHALKLDAEEAVIESGLPYTILEPMRYMQHLEPIWSQVKADGAHLMPFSIERRFNLVDLLDLAEATAIVATRPGHLYATYELAGPQSLSMKDVAAQLSAALQRPVKAQAQSFAALESSARAKGMNEDRVRQMLVMNRHYDRHGFLGNPNVLTWLLGRPPTTFDAYVRRLMQAG